MTCNILRGDCLEVMRTFPDNHFSAIVTDPPYGLSFMGKGWDHAVPGIEYWRECLRVIKPGGFLLAMGGTRTFHRLTCAIEDSGFEVRDCIMYLYGSGFPKSHSISKAIDKSKGIDKKSSHNNGTSYNWSGCNDSGECIRSKPSSNLAQIFEGYGTALKPAHEPIIMAMKPIDGTFAQNAEKWGQAGINIDECRISTDENTSRPFGPQNEANTYSGSWGGGESISSPKGRWPANVILDEEAGKFIGDSARFFYKVEDDDSLFCRAKSMMESWNPDFANIANKNTVLPKEYVDFALDLAVKKADQEGKRLKNIQIPSMNVTVQMLENLCMSVIIMTLNIEKKFWHGLFHINMEKSLENHVLNVEIQRLTDITQTMINPMNSFGFVVDVMCENMSDCMEAGEKDLKSRIIYCAKASSRERNEGLEELPDIECQTGCSGAMPIDDQGKERDRFKKIAKNNHPTVKPLKLMQYLIKLVMPPKDGILLDPFAGSGSTILAAKRLGVQAIGIEKELEYCDIAKKRLDSYSPPSQTEMVFDL